MRTDISHPDPAIASNVAYYSFFVTYHHNSAYHILLKLLVHDYFRK